MEVKRPKHLKDRTFRACQGFHAELSQLPVFKQHTKTRDIRCVLVPCRTKSHDELHECLVFVPLWLTCPKYPWKCSHVCGDWALISDLGYSDLGYSGHAADGYSGHAADGYSGHAPDRARAIATFKVRASTLDDASQSQVTVVYGHSEVVTRGGECEKWSWKSGDITGDGTTISDQHQRACLTWEGEHRILPKLIRCHVLVGVPNPDSWEMPQAAQLAVPSQLSLVSFHRCLSFANQPPNQPPKASEHY
jgi:hypothetical protein